MENNNLQKSLLKKWLDKLQEESWNLELLISGFSIFGLLKFKDYLSDLNRNLNANDIESLSTLFYFNLFLKISLFCSYIFIFFLLIHVIYRGMWIGAIGLRYVSGEIEYDKLNYNPIITQYLKRKVGNFDDYILKLEKISSLIFGFTFLLIFVILSFGIYFIFLLIIGSLLDKLQDYSNSEFISVLANIILWVIVLIGFISAIDFFTGGVFKKIKSRRFARIYLPINRLMSFITLSIFWKPLYYNLIDNRSTKKLIYLIIPLILISFLILSLRFSNYSIFPDKIISSNPEITSSEDEFKFNPNFYDNLREEKQTIKTLSIPSNKIHNKFMTLFVKLNLKDEKAIFQKDSSIQKLNIVGVNSRFQNNPFEKKVKKDAERFSESNDFTKNSRAFYKTEKKEYSKNLEKILQASKSIYKFKINHILIPEDSIGFLFDKRIEHGEEGFEVSFPLHNVKTGLNYLTLDKAEYNEDKEQLEWNDITIPFYYIPE